MKKRLLSLNKLSLNMLSLNMLSLAVLTFLFSSCGDASLAFSVSEGNSYRSLIDIESDSEIQFQRTSYDLSGETILLIDTVTLIQKVVELPKDTLSKYGYDNDTHFGSIRWESSSIASLISFRQPDTDLQNGGMTICGTITDTDTLLNETPILWLPFPAIDGTLSDQLSDDVLDINQIHSANSSRLNSFGFAETAYVYLNESGDKQIYSWFSIGSHLTAQLEYRNGKRIRSLQVIQ